MDSIAVTEAACAANAVAPRVSENDIKNKIADIAFFTGGAAITHVNGRNDYPGSLDVLTICLLTMKNGFTVVGKSAPASVANFNAELGRDLAYEDAFRQLWPMEGYLLRERQLEDPF